MTMISFVRTTLLFGVVIFFNVKHLTSQSSQALEQKSSAWAGMVYYYQGEKISKGKVRELLADDQVVLKQFNKGAGQHSTSLFLSFLGGGLIGWPIGSAIGGKPNPEWYLAGIGAGLVVGSAIIYSSGVKKIKVSLENYNQSGLGNNNQRIIPQYSIVISGHGLGINMKL